MKRLSYRLGFDKSCWSWRFAFWGRTLGKERTLSTHGTTWITKDIRISSLGHSADPTKLLQVELCNRPLKMQPLLERNWNTYFRFTLRNSSAYVLAHKIFSHSWFVTSNMDYHCLLVGSSVLPKYHPGGHDSIGWCSNDVLERANWNPFEQSMPTRQLCKSNAWISVWTDRTVDNKLKNRHVIFVVNVKMLLY